MRGSVRLGWVVVALAVCAVSGSVYLVRASGDHDKAQSLETGDGVPPTAREGSFEANLVPVAMGLIGEGSQPTETWRIWALIYQDQDGNETLEIHKESARGSIWQTLDGPIDEFGSLVEVFPPTIVYGWATDATVRVVVEVSSGRKYDVEPREAGEVNGYYALLPGKVFALALESKPEWVTVTGYDSEGRELFEEHHPWVLGINPMDWEHSDLEPD